MEGVLGVIFAPALISLVVSLWANRRSEASRARRDNITKFFEATREDVRRSVEVAIEYFATAPEERTMLQEAKVILADHELRASMPVVLGPHPELTDISREVANSRFLTLLAELTGANFQVKTGSVDSEHMRRLAHAGAGLRSALARMRDAELRMLIEADPVHKFWKRVLTRFDNHVGLPPPPN